jgi:hypothetical protein
MLKKIAVILSAISLSFSGLVTAQQSTTTGQTQASTLLAQSLAALGGSASISDITLTGTAQWIAGSDDETGTAVLKAMAAGESRVDLSLSGGARTEIRTFDSNNNQIGAWSGIDAVQHAISNHNLMTDSSWFFPALTFSRLVNNTNSKSSIVAIYVGQETLSGKSVLHVSVSRPPSSLAGQGAPLLQHLTEMDFYLDPNTLLPLAVSFTAHPDNNALLDIPVQIQFSNYQKVSGVQIPFHIQKYMNGTLSIDMQVQSAVLNSGLSESTFAVQVTQ